MRNEKQPTPKLNVVLQHKICFVSISVELILALLSAYLPTYMHVNEVVLDKYILMYNFQFIKSIIYTYIPASGMVTCRYSQYLSYCPL